MVSTDAAETRKKFNSEKLGQLEKQFRKRFENNI